MSSPLLLTVAVLVGLLVVLLAALPLLRRGGQRRRELGELYRKALEALVEGRVREAVGWLREIALRQTEDWNAQLLLGDLLRQLGETEKALRIHRVLESRFVKGTAARLRILESLARDWLALKRWDRALQAARDMEQMDRNEPAVWEIQWRALDALGRMDEAWEALKKLDRKALRRVPEVPPLAHYRAAMGRHALEQGDARTARSFLQEAWKSDPHLAPAGVWLGDALLALGKAEEAVATWRELAGRLPEEAELVFGRLENALFQLGRFDDLNAVYEEILRRDPDHPGATAALARMQMRRGAYDEAERWLRMLLDKHPGDRRGRRLLLGTLVAAGKSEEARRMMQDWLEEDAPAQVVCRACGRAHEDVYLQCESCGAWWRPASVGVATP
jgi:lipopolysaccharide biosynthesis regulator YciM